MIEYFTRRNKKRNIDNWEEVPDEDLWEDGELNVRDVKSKIFRMLHLGKYTLIRRIEE